MLEGKDEILPTLSSVLEHTAKDWLRAVHVHILTWTAFKDTLLRAFLSEDHDLEAERRIWDRIQRPDAHIRDFAFQYQHVTEYGNISWKARSHRNHGRKGSPSSPWVLVKTRKQQEKENNDDKSWYVERSSCSWIVSLLPHNYLTSSGWLRKHLLAGLGSVVEKDQDSTWKNPMVERQTFKLANGNTQTAIGKINKKCEIHRTLFSSDFYVMRDQDFHFPCILGLDFLNAHQVKVDFRWCALTLHNADTSVTVYNDPFLATISLLITVTPPKVETEIRTLVEVADITQAQKSADPPQMPRSM